jgi:tetratricopeptide (TPR) repeat protein
MLVAYHNVGRVFKELGQYDVAMDHLNLAKKMSEQQNDAEGIPYAYDEIGDVQLRKMEYDSALATLALALKESRKLHINLLEPKIHSKIALVRGMWNSEVITSRLRQLGGSTCKSLAK